MPKVTPDEAIETGLRKEFEINSRERRRAPRLARTPCRNSRHQLGRKG